MLRVYSSCCVACVLKLWGCGGVQALESGIRVQQGTLNSMNAAGNDIVRQAAAPDAQLLKQRQENINRRWKALCSEVFDRQKHSGRSATLSPHAYCKLVVSLRYDTERCAAAV